MNRRSFLKSIATVCGAAVVCPGELLKSPVEFRPNPAQRVYGVGWHDFNPFGSETERKKYRQNIYTMHNFGGRCSGYIITRPE